MKCLVCKKENAIKHPLYGWLPGKNCQRKQQEMAKPKVSAEITTENIKEDRKIFKKDLVQPFRQNELSKEFVEANPEVIKNMIKEGHVTKEEVVKARPVWGENEYYKR